MAKGIIYLMTTAVPGLVKIGKTSSDNYSQRMYNLESNGYRNVTSLKRAFAIEVEDYSEKELLLHTIFEKSRVSDTELFALDVNIVVQLLSSFEGKVVYPESETKSEIFTEAVDNSSSCVIPDGVYYFSRKKKSDDKIVTATAEVVNGSWTLLKGAVFGEHVDAGVSDRAKALRSTLPLDSTYKLLDDVKLGECSPTYAGVVVLNSACDGWVQWKTAEGKPIDIFRKKTESEE